MTIDIEDAGYMLIPNPHRFRVVYTLKEIFIFPASHTHTLPQMAMIYGLYLKKTLLTVFF